MEYGNKVVTEYSYNPWRRWLDTIVTTNPGGCREYQNIEYSFDPVGNIEGYRNEVYGYRTEQQYSYDALNQLVSAGGTYEHTPYNTQVDYTSRYSQEYDFDSLGNFSRKTSSQGYSPNRSPMGSLNYNLEYRYREGKSHRVQWVGNTHYSYDANGNIIEEREGGPSVEATAGISALVKDGVLRSVNRGFALIRNPDESEETVAMRSYEWDEENRLTGYADRRVNMAYTYDADNQRTVKYHIQAGEETLYFDQFWQGVNEDSDFRQSKHIYLGETRIATRLNLESRNGSTDNSYELANTYYYHPDHLGSAHFVTDRHGGRYEHMEYTPYGELWEEQVSDSHDMIPFRFTAKEWDEETGLYYYGARYLDPKRGRWLSADPAGPELGNPNREGFSIVEAANWYVYASNNPINKIDPTGLDDVYLNYDRGKSSVLMLFVGRTQSGGIDESRVVKKNFDFTNKVYTPAERNNTPVTYDPDNNPSNNNSYNYFPTTFPNSPKEGWDLGQGYKSTNPYVGLAIPTNANQDVDTYSKDAAGNWVKDGTVNDTGYLLHEGVGATTWGCLKSDADTVKNLMKYTDAAVITGGNAKLFTSSKKEND